MEDLVTEFNGELAVPVKPGQYFDIEVSAIDEPKSFHISLAKTKLNKHPEADIGLNVEIQFDKHQITANTRFGDQWGNAVVADCPIITDPSDDTKTIRVNIQIWESTFQISVNDEHKLKMFDGGIGQPLTAIQIAGDIKLITRMDHRQVYPKLWPTSAAVPYYVHRTYLSNDIPIQFRPGHLIVITARCFGNPNGSFNINLKHAHNESLLMHFFPQFQSKKVVRNYLYPSSTERFGQIWAIEEEEDGGFPFDFHKPFRLGIAFREDDLVIAVNGLYFCSYKYRNPENRFLDRISKRPYNHILSNIVGIKVYGRQKLGIKITEVDHIQLNSVKCNDFEKYTKMDSSNCEFDKLSN